MYLKRIEAQGFKSFADKLDLEMDSNITCVVGPNGSGKSNVVDAIRWVLGEQSVKNLRGTESMTDVIFSGSKSRNGLNVATVNLIFDNSDNYLKIPYTEVSVKRRIYRTGENEYFLNGDKCRLKDITDLFIDTGIGKEGLNIISQGEVQKIISNSSNDRRVVFESAAGVLKYKKRKEEAIRKLDKTKINLDRVNDIISEIEDRLEPLKEQSRKALEYKDNKEKLEKIEIALIQEEITSINNKFQESKDKINNLKEELLKIDNNNTNLSVNIDNKKISLLNLENKISNLNNNLLELTKELEKINSDKKLINERVKLDAKDKRVYENIKFLKEDSLKLDNDIKLLIKEIDDDQIYIKSLIDKLNDINNNLDNINNLKDNSLKELNYKKRETYDLENKINSLKNYIESLNNLPSSIKYLLNNPKFKGVHNIIGNIVSTESKYMKALDISLGASKNFIIVDNNNTAKECIKYLKDNNLGRNTFFPIDVIKSKYVLKDTLDLIKDDKAFIGVMSSVCEFDPIYKNIIENQLGNVLLVDNIDNATIISKKIDNKYKIVTLDGDIIHVGGSLTGGSINNSRSIISDKLELSNLENKYKSNLEIISELETKINEIDINLNLELNKKDDLQKKYLLNKQIVDTKLENLNLKKDNLESINSELNSLDSLVKDNINSDLDNIFNLYYEKEKELNSCKLELNKYIKEKDLLNNEIDELIFKNKSNNQEFNLKQKELNELEIIVSKFDIKLDNYLNKLSEEYEITYEKAREDYHLECDINEARELVNTYKLNIKRIGMVSLDSIEEYEKTNERYEFLTGQRDDLLNAKETLLEIINEMDSVMKNEFLETFKKIQIEFELVFKRLFGGEKASLKLTDPDNLLETGVDIIASPPGKKLSTISLLSGGEKTLTAISLLFAILNVSPIPFCIFDEVEAALDEANVDNFGKYLESYKEKTQFLLITHKKKTMEYANILYGITMQESGVSKLVSVKFENN